MGKSTISMAIFNSKLFVYQRVSAVGDRVFRSESWRTEHFLGRSTRRRGLHGLPSFGLAGGQKRRLNLTATPTPELQPL